MTGYMEIYEDTYEKLSFMVKKKEEEQKPSKPQDEDDALDMFGEAFDEKIQDKDSGVLNVTMPIGCSIFLIVTWHLIDSEDAFITYIF